MNNITALTQTEAEELKRIYSIVDLNDDSIISKHLSSGILDRFNRILSEEEASNLLTNKWINREDEKKYLNCFREIINQLLKFREVYIRCPNLDKLNMNGLKEDLSVTEYKFLLIIKQVFKTEFFKINDDRLVTFLFNLALREIILFDFYLPEISTMLMGNFDLSIPVYCEENETLKQIQTIANTSELYIRNIELKV